MMGVIYKATNKINGKSYIGQTIHFEIRKKEHLNAKDDYAFHQALKKYGENNFIWEILEECDSSLLNEREIYWISFYNTYSKGYNTTTGGDNADQLLKWKKEHKEEVRSQALKALKLANESNKQNREKHCKHLDEIRPKALKARKKKVRCIELNLIFEGLSDAERWSLTDKNPNGKRCTHQQISKVCKGHAKTTGGYHWEYVQEE